MKKIVSLVLAVMLVAMCCSVFVTAEDIYKFHVDGINLAHAGEDNYISNNNDALANANTKWAITIHLKHVEGSVYEAVADAITGKGEPANITLGEGEIAFSVHSSSSNVAEIDQYPNVNDKNAAAAITAGTYFVFTGVTSEQIMAGDLPAGVTVVATTTKPDGEAPVETPSEEEPSEAPAEKGENLLAGLTYTFEGTKREPDGFSDINEDGSCKNRLTDGVYAENPGGEQIAAYNGGPTSFVFDLGEVTDIAGFYCDGYSGNWGIPAPTSVEFLVSEDGEAYVSVGVVEANDDNSAVIADPWVKHEFKLDKAASGRYIKVVYTTTVHTWLSEIEAYAVAEGGSETPSETPSETSTEKPAETADNGIVALAIISAIAVAGAVIVKKSR